MLLGLCGFVGSGKGAIVDYLKRKGWSHYATKDVIREELAKHDIPATRNSMIMMGNTLRAQHGGGVLAQRMMLRMPLAGNVIVESIRHPDEVRTLRKRADFVLLAVSAHTDLRFRRIATRARPGDPTTIEELRALDDRESDTSSSGVRIKECVLMAEATIVNDGTLEKLHRSVDEFLLRYR